MPVYEFLCRRCNRIYSFHSFRVNPDKVPTCPKCSASDLTKVPSRFGVGASRKAAAAEPGSGEADFDDPRLEREMMRFAAELEGMDENDPRAMAAAVRRMTEIAGEPITPTMEEMIRRLEAGEDPEKVEEDMADVLGDDATGGVGGMPSRDDGLYEL